MNSPNGMVWSYLFHGFYCDCVVPPFTFVDYPKLAESYLLFEFYLKNKKFGLVYLIT